jgi:hypothetical protein
VKPSIERKTTIEIGSLTITGNNLSGSSVENPRDAAFNASYPRSKTGYSTKPTPLGITRNSDSRQENTAST